MHDWERLGDEAESEDREAGNEPPCLFPSMSEADLMM